MSELVKFLTLINEALARELKYSQLEAETKGKIEEYFLKNYKRPRARVAFENFKADKITLGDFETELKMSPMYNKEAFEALFSGKVKKVAEPKVEKEPVGDEHLDSIDDVEFSTPIAAPVTVPEIPALTVDSMEPGVNL